MSPSLILRSLHILAFSGALAAQTTPPATPPEKLPPPHSIAPKPAPAGPSREQLMARAEAVPDTTPVIVIPNVCPADKVKTLCQTVITKKDFEALLNAMSPGMPPEARRNVARAYANLLTKAAAAREANLDKDPGVLARIEFAKLRLLEQALDQRLQTKAAEIPDEEIRNYYDANPAAYEEITLRRVYVPVNMKKDAAGNMPADPKALAGQVRERLVKGEEPDKLQREVFDIAKLETPPPNTSIGNRRRGSLPPAHEAGVFELKQGEVSAVFSETSGHFIYQAESRRVLPYEQVREEIKRALQSQRYQDEQAKLLGKSRPEMNEDYFGPEGAAAPPPGVRPPGARPPARPAQPPTNPPPPGPK